SIQLITRKNFRKFSMRCRKKKLNDCDTSKFYNKMGHFQKILTAMNGRYKTEQDGRHAHGEAADADVGSPDDVTADTVAL
ncbi:hypothetical protein, partial [Stecheria intestinalis]|uniref:hypothetical protein n=1 Tax=Stecheria intestinalis TaxID=2606630 RepID=UPI0019818944